MYVGSIYDLAQKKNTHTHIKQIFLLQLAEVVISLKMLHVLGPVINIIK